MKRILAVAAHPDDEILGLGATIHRFVKEGCEASAIILGEGLTSRGASREETSLEELQNLKNDAFTSAKKIGYSTIEFFDFPDNRFDSVDLLEIIKAITTVIERYNPDTIFTHFGGDLNIDHRRTYQAVVTACRPLKHCNVSEIYCFETPSSTEWNFGLKEAQFMPNMFVDVTDSLQTKLEAMACYHTENREFPHPRSREALEAIAKRWGSVVGKTYAEAFQLVRKII